MQNVILAWTHAIHTYTERKPLRRISLFFVVLLITLTAISIYAQRADAAPNTNINFQARILSNTGAVVGDGFYSVEFNIYAQNAGGTTQWTETQVLTSKNGYLTASLGSVTPFGSNIDWSQEQWLSMNINGDGEMNPRMKITAVPFALRAKQADLLTTTTGTIAADQLAQLAPGLVQSVNSANTALRINQTGSGNLLQLQGNGSDVLTVSKAGDLATARGITLGTSSLTTAGTIRWTGVDFEGYDGSAWVSLTSGGGGGTGNSSITLTSSTANMAATATTAAGLLNFTSATAVSSAAGTTTGFVAPADGSFRSCVVNNNAAITAGSVSIRWRVNGVSTGAVACTMNNTNPRYGASTIDAGVVTFAAGDTINIAFESAGLAPAGSTEFTAYWTVEFGGSGAPSNAFVQGGNSFGASAVLGTTDSNGLNIITSGLSRLTVSAAGSVDINNDLTVDTGLIVNAGGIAVTGNSSISGTLTGLTGLTVASGGATVTGGLDLNSGGITDAGDILGVGTALTASGGLTISTSGANSLQLDSGNDVLVLNDATLRRTAIGTTTLELNDTANTTFSILNSDGTAVAGLSVEGSIAGQSFSGDGASLTNLDASALATGTLNDSRLSSNVALLNTAQNYSALQTFSSGLQVGNTSSGTAGTIRWTGTDFEGYDGSAWVSLTSGGGGGGGAPGSVVSVIKDTDEIIASSTTLQDDNQLTFAIGANDEWTFRFVVQANSGSTPNVQFAVTAPSGAVCDISFIDAEGAVASSNTACGVTSGVIAGTGTNEVYEITGSVRNGATPGNITLQWAQNSSDASNTTVYAGSYVNAIPVSGGPLTPVNAFVQGGNSFGATALLGTTDANDLSLITGGLVRMNISSTGETTIGGLTTVSGNLVANANTLLNGDVSIGDASTDVLTLNSDSIVIPNGLSIDSGTLAIDSTSNTVGINNITPANTLSINTPATVDSNAEVLIYTNGINKKGLVLQTATGQLANSFEVQQDNGVAVLAVNGTGGLILGSDISGSSSAGQLVLNDNANANGFTNVLGTNTVTANRSINLPDADGTICLSGSSLCGFIALGPSSAQTDASTNSSIFINKTGASGDILTLQKNGTAILRMLNSGALQLQLDNVSAFSVKNASGTNFFNVDTVAGLVRVGSSTADGTGTLLVLDTKNTAGDPTGVEGASYFNSTTSKMRCYENGYWSDCATTRTQDDVTLATPTNSISLTLPSNVSNLQCYIKAPGLSAASRVDMRVNNISAANSYGYNVLQNITGANNNTSTSASATATEVRLTGTGASTGSFSANVNINNFAGVPKAIDWTGVTASTTGVPANFKGSGVYYTTTGSISSVQFLTSAGNFNTGTRAWCEAR